MTIRLVSLGDSFTEGVGDYWPDGSERGWADRLAHAWAGAVDEPFEYANLAIRGRKLRAIIDEQLETALEMSPAPTHVTFNGGGNDMFGPRFNLDRILEMCTYVLERCAIDGVPLIIVTFGPPTAGLPFAKRFLRRSQEYMEGVYDVVGGRAGVTVVDNVACAELAAPRYWSPDRLHLGALGHEFVARRVLAALGIDGAAADASHADAASGAAVADDPEAATSSESEYWREHVLPWLVKRAQGRSAGDGREPKHPDWVRVNSDRPWAATVVT